MDLYLGELPYGRLKLTHFARILEHPFGSKRNLLFGFINRVAVHLRIDIAQAFSSTTSLSFRVNGHSIVFPDFVPIAEGPPGRIHCFLSRLDS
jgi:hypothetical protein